MLLGETFFFRDLHLHFYPQKLRFVELLRAGEFPLWDPFLHGGQPFLADLNNMALYPFNFVYLLLPSVLTFNLDIIFHVLLSAVAAYWLARSFGVSQRFAMIAGAIYGFCGYTLSLTNLLSRLTAMPYLPFMVLSLRAFLKSEKSRWFVLCVVFGFLQILAGAPEMTLLTFLFLLGWLLFAESDRTASRRLVLFLALTLFVLGISAIQILPTYEMAEQSVRAKNTDYNSFSAWSLHWKRLPEMIIPQFFGYTDRFTRNAYWGGGMESMGFPFIVSIYFGWITLALASFGAFSQQFPIRFRILLISIAFVSILVSFGRYLPGFQNLYELIPLAGAVRYPVKFLVATILPIALLAAFGAEKIFQSANKRAVVCFYVAALFFAFWAILFRVAPGLLPQFLTAYFGPTTEIAISALKASLTHTALISAAAAAIYHYWITKPISFQPTAFAALLLFDLIRSGIGVNPYAPREFLTLEPELARAVKNQIETGRYYRSPNPPGLTLKLPSNEFVYFSRWNLETLQNYAATMYDIPLIYHEDFDNLAKRELGEIGDYILRASWEERLPFLTAGGVSLFLTADSGIHSNVEPLRTVRNSSNRLFYLYRNPGFNGNVYFVQQAIKVSTDQEAFDQMKKMGFQPSQTVVIRAEDLPAENAKGCGKAAVRITEQRPSFMRYDTDIPCDGYIYFAQPFYEGWITKINGKEVPSLRANYAFSASVIPAGKHTVERSYRPKFVITGCMISIASLILLAIFSISVYRRRPRLH